MPQPIVVELLKGSNEADFCLVY